MKELFVLNNDFSTLTVYEEHCSISNKKTFSTFLNGRAFNGTKEFYYCDLGSIQYKEPGKIFSGFIQFEYPCTNENSFLSENTFPIMKSSNSEDCKRAYEYIRGKIAVYKAIDKTAPSAFSPADELKKYKELLDAGAITQEEFDTKKKQLLGL